MALWRPTLEGAGRVAAPRRQARSRYKAVGPSRYVIRDQCEECQRLEDIDTTIACPIDVGSCHYLRNGLADVGRVTGEVIRYGQPEPMRL